MDYREWKSHTRYLTYGKDKKETRGRSKHKNNARVVGNLGERNVGTKGKSHNQDLNSAKDLTIEGRESPYHRLD